MVGFNGDNTNCERSMFASPYGVERCSPRSPGHCGLIDYDEKENFLIERCCHAVLRLIKRDDLAAAASAMRLTNNWKENLITQKKPLNESLLVEERCSRRRIRYEIVNGS